jgi:hypothetical protein
MEELRVVAPIGALGYGINAESLKLAMERDPHFIGVDAGSTDAGPYYLGSGGIYMSYNSTKRDIKLLLKASCSRKIPLIIGSAGCAGSAIHVKWTTDIIEEVAQEENLHFKLAIIYADQEKKFLKNRIKACKTKTLYGVKELTPEAVDSCTRIVAQMGTAPYIKALDEGAEVIVAGRSCDTAIFAGYAIREGFDPGLSLHMGKICECGAMSALPSTGRDVIMGILRKDHFIIEVPNPNRRVTPGSIAGHMVYEVEHPYLQEEPTGCQDFFHVKMEAYGERATKVSGTRFIPREKPTLKFEGAAPIGYRSFILGGTRDPFLIVQIDEYVKGCTAEVEEIMRETNGQFRIDWKLYGRDAIMGSMEPMRDKPSHELGILVQVLAPTQKEAHDICALMEGRMIGFSYKESKTRTANIAFPFSPIINDTGTVYRFNVFHVVELDDVNDLERLFRLEFRAL